MARTPIGEALCEASPVALRSLLHHRAKLGEEIGRLQALGLHHARGSVADAYGIATTMRVALLAQVQRAVRFHGHGR